MSLMRLRRWPARVDRRLWAVVIVIVAPLGRVSQSGIGVRAGGGGQRPRRRPRAREQDDGRMTMTTTTLAVGGTTLMIDETVTSSRAAATVMALPNVSSAPPPARCRPISFARGGMRLGRCRLEAMLMTTTATTAQLTMMTGGSERMNPLYLLTT